MPLPQASKIFVNSGKSAVEPAPVSLTPLKFVEPELLLAAAAGAADPEPAALAGADAEAGALDAAAAEEAGAADDADAAGLDAAADEAGAAEEAAADDAGAAEDAGGGALAAGEEAGVASPPQAASKAENASPRRMGALNLMSQPYAANVRPA